MMTRYFQLGVQLALVCLLASGMFIAARVHYLLKIGLATVMVGLLVYSWAIAIDLLGYPVAGYPKDNSVLIDVNVDRSAKAIYYWVKEKDGPRAYVVPYHEDQSNKASEAKAKATQTQGQMVFHSKSKEKGERETANMRRIRAMGAAAPAKASAVAAERPHHRKPVLVVVNRRLATAPRQPSVARSPLKSTSTSFPLSPLRIERGYVTRSLRRKRAGAREGFLPIAHRTTTNQRGRLFLFQRAADATGKGCGDSDDAVRDLQAERGQGPRRRPADHFGAVLGIVDRTVAGADESIARPSTTCSPGRPGACRSRNRQPRPRRPAPGSPRSARPDRTAPGSPD